MKQQSRYDENKYLKAWANWIKKDSLSEEALFILKSIENKIDNLYSKNIDAVKKEDFTLSNSDDNIELFEDFRMKYKNIMKEIY